MGSQWFVVARHFHRVCSSLLCAEFEGQFTDRPLVAQQFITAGSPAAFVRAQKQLGASAGELAEKVDGLAASLGERPRSFQDW